MPKLDIDLLAFLVTVATILSKSLPRLRRNLPFIPRDYEFEELSPEALTEQQRAFFAKFDEKLLPMSYRTICTYRVTNYVPNLIRYYFNPADRASCKVMIVETRVKVNGEVISTNSSLVAFRTTFTDGKELTTRNMRRRTVLDHPPEYIVQEFPSEEDVAFLKKRHDARAAKLGVPVAPPASASAIFDHYQREHRRFSEFQVESGTFIRVPGGYRSSDKTHWRGIRNFLVPFAERFSVSRLAMAAILAVGIPSVTYLRVLPEVIWRARNAGFDPTIASTIVFCASYVLAGAAVGLIVEMNEFIWAFLFTFVGVHLATGWWHSVIPFGVIAGAVSHAVARLQKRKRVVLRTREFA